MLYQLLDWQKNGLFSEMTDSQIFLVSLLAGDWKTARSYALTWPQTLGVFFWYAESRECPLEKILGNFLEAMKGEKIASVAGEEGGEEGLIELMKLFVDMREGRETSFMSILDEKSILFFCETKMKVIRKVR